MIYDLMLKNNRSPVVINCRTTESLYERRLFMKARKRNIISFAICALFVAGLLAGSCYIKEGKQNAVTGYAGTEQGDIIWEYDTVSGDESR